MPRPAKGFQVRISPEQREEIRVLYWNGTPYQDIVARFGCSESNFWRIVRDMRKDMLSFHFEVRAEALAQIPEAKLGWIAGIVDGEGYIGIVQAKNKRQGSFTLMPRVEVVSTTRCMQDELERLLGFGCVYPRPSKKPNEQTKFVWSIWSAPVVGPFLAVLEPHLIVKRRVAEVVRKFCETRIEHDMEPYTEDNLASVCRVRELNRRGTVDRSTGSTVVPVEARHED